jgi:hypothetical protein
MKPLYNLTHVTQVKVEFEGCQVSDMSPEDIHQFCLTIPEVVALNGPDSDYAEQYYDIQVSADSVTYIYRKME